MADFPLPFWLAAGLVLGLIGFFVTKRYEGYGFPACAVLATVGAWYLGDALYNDYAGYVKEFGPRILETAWWQVVLFLVTFAALVKPLHNSLNRKLAGRKSRVCVLMETKFLENANLQNKIDKATSALFGAWVVLMFVALWRTDWNFQGLFLPFLADRAEPWARGRIGGGIDALISFGNYIHTFLVAAGGLALAISRRPGTRMLAGIVFFLGAPYFFFGRTRNTMLAVLLPGLLAWVFFRLKGGLLVRGAVLAVAFAILNAWFAFVLQIRSGGSVAAAFAQGGVGAVMKATEGEEAKHLGFNMYEELAWCALLIEQGRYRVNWGERYFAELVNVVPRALWKNKPLIGVDYALARGFGWEGAEAGEGGIAASISTGMIGQGVVNFGGFLGPMAAALLMALWAVVLAKQDLTAEDPARLLLYGVGMILTFNLGRDITLITIYPFLFGWMILTWWDSHRAKVQKKQTVGEAGRQAVRGSPLRMTREKIEEQRMKERAGG